MKYILLFFALFVPVIASADSAVITWTPPATRVDGSALPAGEIDSYILRQNGVEVDVISGTATSYQIDNLSVGEYCYDMQTVDSEGRSGPFSVVVCKTVKAAPGAPAIQQIQIVW